MFINNFIFQSTMMILEMKRSYRAFSGSPSFAGFSITFPRSFFSVRQQLADSSNLLSVAELRPAPSSCSTTWSRRQIEAAAAMQGYIMIKAPWPLICGSPSGI